MQREAGWVHLRLRQAKLLASRSITGTNDYLIGCGALVDLDCVDAGPAYRQLAGHIQAHPCDKHLIDVGVINPWWLGTNSGLAVHAHIVGRRANIGRLRNGKPHYAGPRQALRGVIHNIKRDQWRSLARTAGRVQRHLPCARHCGARADFCKRIEKRQRRHEADVENLLCGVLAANGVTDGVPVRGLGCDQRKPQALVQRARAQIHAIRIGLVLWEERRRGVAGGLAGESIQRLQPSQQRLRLRLLLTAQRGLDVDLARQRQQIEFTSSFKGCRTGKSRRRQQPADAGPGWVRCERNHTTCSSSGLQWLTEQLEKREPLPLRNQIGPVEDRIAQPRKQLDQRLARIARLRGCPLRRMRRNGRKHLLQEIVVRAVVERWRYQRHVSTRFAALHPSVALVLYAAGGSGSGYVSPMARRA